MHIEFTRVRGICRSRDAAAVCAEILRPGRRSERYGKQSVSRIVVKLPLINLVVLINIKNSVVCVRHDELDKRMCIALRHKRVTYRRAFRVMEQAVRLFGEYLKGG